MKHWYSFKSKDGNIRGYALEKGKQQVARFAEYPISELHIEKVVWNGEEFVSEDIHSI